MENRFVPSRRHFVGTGISAMFCASFEANAQRVVPPAGDAAGIATGESGANLLTIDVRIDGKGPFQFVVDTGADRSVIADDVARQVDLAYCSQVMIEGVVRTISAQTARIRSLVAGPVELEDFEVPILPRAQLQADGYLGLDVIDKHRVVLDFGNHTLSIASGRPRQLVGWAPPREIPVPVVGRAGHLRSLNCIVDGIRATAFVDTGAEISVGNSRLYQRLVELDSGYVLRENIPLTGVTGGVVMGRVTQTKSIRLNGLSVEASRIAIADLQIFELWGLADTPALLIGMNWLRQFAKVSIDFASKELRFELAKAALIARRA